jgi:riboflavin synthase
VFTGIVEELGRVVAVEHGAPSARRTVEGPLVAADTVHESSTAVDGGSLTPLARDDAAGMPSAQVAAPAGAEVAS